MQTQLILSYLPVQVINLNFFSRYCKNWPMWMICRAGKQPESTKIVRLNILRIFILCERAMKGILIWTSPAAYQTEICWNWKVNNDTPSIISSCSPARPITHNGRLLHLVKKKVNRLPAMVDNPHLKSKENLYKKALQFITFHTRQNVNSWPHFVRAIVQRHVELLISQKIYLWSYWT